ncbi:Chitinase A precursor [compost metagenome]
MLANQLGGLFAWEIDADNGDILNAMHEGLGHGEGTLPPVNKPPVANAGSDLSVTGPAEVILNGAASHDPESGVLTYSWKQVSGPQAGLLDATQAKARVVLDAATTDINLVFELTVTDDQGLSAKDQVVVTNKAPQPNLPPVVSVPASATVESGKQVTIKATASDPNGDALSYQWSLPAGLTATGQDSATLVVTGPSVTSDTVYDLTLMVTDGALDASAGTRLTVKPASTGGGCEATDPDAANWPAWSAGTVYNTNDKVSHNQLVWQAKYWTQGNEPSQSADQWKLVSQVQLGWNAAVAYNAGDLTNHNGRKWKAQYWTKGDEPGKAAVWVDQGAASCN